MTKKVLIVANETAGSTQLKEAVLREVERGDVEFTLVVPASRSREGLTWTEGESKAVAEERLAAALTALEGAGATIKGHVGDESPAAAIEDALKEDAFDELIVSTLPPGMSRWLKQDLPEKAKRLCGLPVTHVVAEATSE